MTDISVLRADFVAVRAFFVDCGEWAAEDAIAIADDIGACVRADDMGMLAFWGEWFAHWGHIARAHAAQMAALAVAAAEWWRVQGRMAA